MNEQEIREKLDVWWRAQVFDYDEPWMTTAKNALLPIVLAYGNQRELEGRIKESERHKDPWGKERTKELKQQKDAV